jgi:RNA polymerase subunit RPABC4/transcription elongation factor Spt4
VKDQRGNEPPARPADGPGTPGPVLRVITPAALALLGDLYGATAICAGCTRAVRPGRACAACGARATVNAAPPPDAAPPPGSPCRRCRTLTARRTRSLCPRCYAQASRVEDYQFLIASGVHPDQAAARVGVSSRTIARDLAATARPRARRGAEEAGLKTA